MKKSIYRKEDFNISKWSGGNTRELAIFPEVSKYLDRDFIWRLSSATVDIEESAFTRLPDYDRVLLVLEGEAVLAHGSERTVSLKEMEQDSFDGAVKTKCFGRIRDYNLMFRKGCNGSLDVIHGESSSKSVDIGPWSHHSHGSCGFFCNEGYIVVSVDGEAAMVKAGEQLVINFEDTEGPVISFMGDGTGVMAQIFCTKEEYVAEEIPPQRATIGDFKAAFKLAHTRHRWNQVMKKGKEKVWYDEALQKRLKVLDRSCMTFIIWLVAAMIMGGLAVGNVSGGGVVGMIIGWTLLHMLVVAPVVTMVVLPKPINAHIKDVDNLTGYERELYEKQKLENQVADKILRKYKFSGRNEYIEDDESRSKNRL